MDFHEQLACVVTSDAICCPSPHSRDNIGFHGIPYTLDKKGHRRHHFTPLGVRPSSHGCVRLADVDARWLFANVSVNSSRRGTMGTTVVVVRTRNF